MNSYILAAAAQEDLIEIGYFLSNQAGESVSQRIIDEIFVGISVLVESPLVGHLREDLVETPVRFWRVYSYYIIYDPQTSPLVVLRVLHSSRDIGRRLNEPEEKRRKPKL